MVHLELTLIPTSLFKPPLLISLPPSCSYLHAQLVFLVGFLPFPVETVQLWLVVFKAYSRFRVFFSGEKVALGGKKKAQIL